MSGAFNAAGWLWLLLAVAALAGVYVIFQMRRKQYAARFSNTELLGSIAPKRPGWRRHLAFAVLLLSLAALTTAMAKPTKEVRVPRDRATVMLALDVSLSMQATDVSPNRFEAAQRSAKDFVDMLPPRINLGLVSFAGSATVLVTPTTDRDQVKNSIDNLKLDQSTAIGDAVLASLRAIEDFQSTLRGDTGEEPPPARIVLLSDGTNTIGHTPEMAAQAAKDATIPVSTIAFGTDTGRVDIGGDVIAVPADKDTLRTLAEDTGGSFHAAATASQLDDVYRDLGSQIGFTKERKEITGRFVGAGLILAFVATGLSLAWTNRLI